MDNATKETYQDRIAREARDSREEREARERQQSITNKENFTSLVQGAAKLPLSASKLLFEILATINRENSSSITIRSYIYRDLTKQPCDDITIYNSLKFDLDLIKNLIDSFIDNNESELVTYISRNDSISITLPSWLKVIVEVNPFKYFAGN